MKYSPSPPAILAIALLVTLVGHALLFARTLSPAIALILIVLGCVGVLAIEREVRRRQRKTGRYVLVRGEHKEIEVAAYSQRLRGIAKFSVVASVLGVAWAIYAVASAPTENFAKEKSNTPNGTNSAPK